jgi:hypothetical protein
MARYDLNPEHFASVRAEIEHLFTAAHAEAEHEKQFALEPAYDQYEKIEQLGMLKLYVLRKDDEAVGFGLFFLNKDMHHSSATFAVNDSIFLSPDDRHSGLAAAMVQAIDTDLRANGAQAVIYQMREGCSFKTLLTDAGYHKTADVWVKD